MAASQTVIFGGGCFWCVEAVFQRLRGVVSVTSGYAGGSTERPTFEQVASRRSGHAEVIRVVFNPDQINYSVLLDVFFSFHDPTSLNRQGNDVGPEYRSVILTTSADQQAATLAYVAKLTEDKVFDRPIVTEVEPLTTFYPAETEHQDFYNRNRWNPYCQFVISPKIAKLRKNFTHLLRDPEA